MTKPETTKKMTIANMIATLSRVIPWSSDAAENSQKVLTGDELTAIRDYLRKRL